jgi:hypothetical protein
MAKRVGFNRAILGNLKHYGQDIQEEGVDAFNQENHRRISRPGGWQIL